MGLRLNPVHFPLWAKWGIYNVSVIQWFWVHWAIYICIQLDLCILYMLVNQTGNSHIRFWVLGGIFPIFCYFYTPNNHWLVEAFGGFWTVTQPSCMGSLRHNFPLLTQSSKTVHCWSLKSRKLWAINSPSAAGCNGSGPLLRIVLYTHLLFCCKLFAEWLSSWWWMVWLMFMGHKQKLTC